MLVEKLTLLAWRQRRLIIAETAEIERAIACRSWNEVQRQAEPTTKISEYGIRHEGGLIRRIADAEVLEGRLELLEKLKLGIEADGFDPNWDAGILTKLYGEASGENWPRTLFDSYRTWSGTAALPEDKRAQHEFSKPDECKENFLAELDEEMKRLERYKKAYASMEVEKGKLEVLRNRFRLRLSSIIWSVTKPASNATLIEP